MRVNMVMEIDSTGALVIEAGGRCYFAPEDVSDFLGWVMRDVVSE